MRPMDPLKAHTPPRSGTEPVRARSARGLRLKLSVLYAPVFLAGAALLAWWAADSSPGDAPGSTVLAVLAALCFALFLAATVDAAVLARRSRD